MEILNEKEKAKTFNTSKIVLNNRTVLEVTGVEKVFESNENKIQLKVANSLFLVSGKNLSVTKLNVVDGLIEIGGIVNEMRFCESKERENFFKRIFK